MSQNKKKIFSLQKNSLFQGKDWVNQTKLDENSLWSSQSLTLSCNFHYFIESSCHTSVIVLFTPRISDLSNKELLSLLYKKVAWISKTSKAMMNLIFLSSKDDISILVLIFFCLKSCKEELNNRRTTRQDRKEWRSMKGERIMYFKKEVWRRSEKTKNRSTTLSLEEFDTLFSRQETKTPGWTRNSPEPSFTLVSVLLPDTDSSRKQSCVIIEVKKWKDWVNKIRLFVYKGNERRRVRLLDIERQNRTTKSALKETRKEVKRFPEETLQLHSLITLIFFHCCSSSSLTVTFRLKFDWTLLRLYFRSFFVDCFVVSLWLHFSLRCLFFFSREFSRPQCLSNLRSLTHCPCSLWFLFCLTSSPSEF